MSLSAVILAAGAVAALWASARVSACEAAVSSIPLESLKETPVANDRRLERLREVVFHPRRFLGPLLLAGLVFNAILILCLTLFCSEVLELRGARAWWAPLLLTTALILVFGEVLPQTLAGRRPLETALECMRCVHALERTGRPFFDLMDRLSFRWAARMTPPSRPAPPGLNEQEYLTMLDVGTREGTLLASERRLIERTLRLGDHNLRELMTPRTAMVVVDAEMEPDQMRQCAVASRHRRLPICNGSRDLVIGILNVRRCLSEAEPDMMVCVEPPAFVPETMTALELLKSFLRGPQRMALVIDEYGGVDGLITMEDLVEEVFGEIVDEYDANPVLWEELEPHMFVAQGAAPLSRLSEWLGVQIEADGVDTLGGWMTDRLGAMPKVGDRCAFRGLTFQVEKMQRLRVETILVRDERRRRE